MVEAVKEKALVFVKIIQRGVQNLNQFNSSY